MKYFLNFISLLTVVLISGCNVDETESNEESITVQLGHTLSINSPWHEGAENFAETIEENTNGRYKVEIFPSGQIASGNQRKAIEMLRQGSYDVDITSSLVWSSFDDQLSITAMPWLFSSMEEVHNTLNGEGGELLMDIVEKNGVKPAGVGVTGFRQMLNNERQIESPKDLENLVIRIPSTPVYFDLYNHFDANPTDMDFTEAFAGMQQGAIDGMEGVEEVIVSGSFYEVLDYMSINNYGVDIFFFTFSDEFFNSLSDEDQKIFLEAGKEATQHINEYSVKRNAEALDYLKEEIKVYEASETEMEEFRDLSSPVYDKYREDINPELREAFNYPE